MALNANAIVTVAEAKAHIGIGSGDTTHDSLLETLIAGASGFIDTYTGRTLQKQTDLSVVATGEGTGNLVLPVFPVASVTSVTDEDGNVTSSGDYTLKAEAGKLKNKGGSWAKGVDYTVVCTTGYQTAGQGGTRTVPLSIVFACLKLVGKAFERRHAEGTTNVSAGESNLGFQRELDIEIKTALDAFANLHV